MKKILIIVVAILSLQCNHLLAQALTIREVDNEDAVIPVNTSSAIVDINSRLSIEILKDSLTRKLADITNTDPDLSKQLKVITYILESQKRLLQLLEPTIAFAGSQANM